MLDAVNANIRIYCLKSNHVVDDAHYSWTTIAQGSISHTRKHHSSFIQPEAQHGVDNNKFAPMTLLTGNYKPLGTAQGSFECKVFV